MNNKLTPKDFFYHLGAVIALYAGAIALLDLIFSVIDYAFPDVLAGYFTPISIAWPISMLVVLVPVLYVLEWLINRDIRLVPDKKEIWVARWRVFLTLFLAGATVVGDLIALINTYLNGEVSGRFILKIVAVLLVAAVIFIYYLMKRLDISKSGIWKNSMMWAGIIIVLASIVIGFMVVGSPGNQRALRLDSQRVSDLTSIQWQIVTYWQQHQGSNLPSSLSLLNDDISGYVVPVDPVTGENYTYKITGTISFDLCAKFDLASLDTQGRNSGYMVSVPSSSLVADTWNHGVGEVCFSRTIDPKKYQPIRSVDAIKI
ncbi:MAG: DUF5671 domain-containing protein [Candidatus Taylorbacteria bacterium]